MSNSFDDFREALGLALRRARLRKGYTQAELGAKARRTQSAIGKLERGPLPGVALNVLYEVCQAIPVSLVEVFNEAARLCDEKTFRSKSTIPFDSIKRLPKEKQLSICKIVEEALTLSPPPS